MTSIGRRAIRAVHARDARTALTDLPGAAHRTVRPVAHLETHGRTGVAGELTGSTWIADGTCRARLAGDALAAATDLIGATHRAVGSVRTPLYALANVGCTAPSVRTTGIGATFTCRRSCVPCAQRAIVTTDPHPARDATNATVPRQKFRCFTASHAHPASSASRNPTNALGC